MRAHRIGLCQWKISLWRTHLRQGANRFSLVRCRSRLTIFSKGFNQMSLLIKSVMARLKITFNIGINQDPCKEILHKIIKTLVHMAFSPSHCIASTVEEALIHICSIKLTLKVRDISEWVKYTRPSHLKTGQIRATNKINKHRFRTKSLSFSWSFSY